MEAPGINNGFEVIRVSLSRYKKANKVGVATSTFKSLVSGTAYKAGFPAARLAKEII